MCTLGLLLREGELAVSGNRNERLDRPASPPAVHDGVLAPRDESAQGTWLGLNRHGLFVCITNRTGAAADPARRSRGLLVRDALQAGSARSLHHDLARLDPLLYNGFHLVYADLREAFVTVGTGARLLQHALPPGTPHLITERSYGAGEGEREHTVRAGLLEAWDPKHRAAGPLEELRRWREPMRGHALAPLESACVHADAAGYGTRSSLQLRLRQGSAAALWTDGHPCTNPPRDLAPLLALLNGGA